MIYLLAKIQQTSLNLNKLYLYYHKYISITIVDLLVFFYSKKKEKPTLN